MARQKKTGDIWSKSTRSRQRLDRATLGVVEPLERRVLLSSITINVTGSGDGTGTLTGTGTYSDTTLRGAIIYADSQTTLSSVITFSSDVSTVTLTNSVTGDLGPLILDNTHGQTITIDGGGVTVKGDVTSVFALTEGTATLNSLNIVGGKTTDNGSYYYTNSSGTASVHFTGSGGGIFNLANLTLSACAVNGNSATANGGGIFSAGTLIITGGSTIGTEPTSTSTLNSATNGGGIYLGGGTALIEGDSHVDGNTASNNGGGIFNIGGTLTVSGGTVSTNSSTDGDGGGIFTDGTAQIYSGCVISGNGVTGGYGGGVFLDANSSATFTAVQINGNSATDGGGIYSAGSLTITGDSTIGSEDTSITLGNSATDGGGIFIGGGTAMLTASYVDGNTASENGGGIYNDGSLNVTGGSISTNSATGSTGSTTTGDGGGLFNSSTGDATTIDQCDINGDGAADLGGGICNQAGGTIGTISGSSPSTLGQVTHDTAQAGGGVYNGGDIGSISYLSVSNNTATSGSANNEGEGGGIYNAGWIIDAEHGSATSRNTGSITSITDCKINYDDAEEPNEDGGSGGGGIFNGSDAVILLITSTDGSVSLSQINDDFAVAQGGGVYNAGQITIENTEIGTVGMSDTADFYGGGILDKLNQFVPQTTTELIGCQIDGDSAEQRGGGIFNYGEFITMSFCGINGDYCGDSGTSDGGGVYSRESLAGDPGTVKIDNSNLDGDYVAPGESSQGGAIDNQSSIATLGQDTINGSGPDSLNALDGGGIFSRDGDLSITGGTITECSANQGGGVEVSGGLATIIDSTITQNTVNTVTLDGTPNPGLGGGIYVGTGDGLGTLTLSLSNVSYNTAEYSGGGLCEQNAGSGTFVSNPIYASLDLISHNTATDGDGGGIATHGYLNATNCTIYGDDAGESGGGIYAVDYQCVLSDDDIYGDSATDGGGVTLAEGVATISFCTIGTNTPGSFSNMATNGGGLFDESADLMIEADTSIIGNTATDGGGIYSTSDSLTIGYMMLSASQVNCNTATSAGGGIFVASSGQESLLGGSVSHDSVTGSDGEGGGIFDSGTLVISGSASISYDSLGGSGGQGAGIYINSGTLTTTISASSVSYDSIMGGSGDGGGIYLDSGAVTLSNVTVNNDAAPDDGGGIYVAAGHDTILGGTITGDSAADGGGIFTDRVTYIESNCVISGDAASDDGGGIYGGSEAVIEIDNSIVGTDSTSGYDHAVNGGGIFLADDGQIKVISYSHIDGDSATGDGGGIYSAGTIVNGIYYSTISNDSVSGGDGGGIFLASASSGATVKYSTIAGDEAEGDGGGIYANGVDDFLGMYASTIAYNTCTSGVGGGVRIDSLALTPKFQDCTVSKNTAFNGGGLSLGSGGDSVNLNNTIVSGNTATGSGEFSDVSGMDEAESGDEGNLVGNTSGSLGLGASNYFTTSPELGTLGFYGGPTSTFFGSPTPTMLPLSGSPAITDTGTTNGLKKFDQRQFPWPASAPTIGAVEVTGGTILEVNTDGDPSGASANGTLSLRQAVSEAYTMSSTPVSIYFNPNVFNFDNSTAIYLTQNSGTLLVQGSNTSIVIPADGLTLVGVVENTGTLMITQANTGGTLSVTQITGSGDLVLGNTLGPAGLVLASTSALVNTQTSLIIGSGSTLDLGENNNALLLSDGGSPATAEAAIQQYVENGQAVSTTGGAIVSSYATTNGYSIGYADASDTNMIGSKLAADNPGDILIEPALAGDTDLNGVVNIHDLQNLLSDFNAPGFWDQGNFNGHTDVDISDLTALLSNFNTSITMAYANTFTNDVSLVDTVLTGTSGDPEAFTVTILSGGGFLLSGFGDDGEGNQYILLAEYYSNGSLDTGFGTDGIVLTNINGLASATSLTVLSNNNIVIAGYGTDPTDSDQDIAVVQYDSVGTLDTAFGSGGEVLIDLGGAEANAMAVLSDNDILVGGYGTDTAGNQDLALVELTSSGSLDTTFGSGGEVLTNAGTDGLITSMQILSDNDILVGGSAVVTVVSGGHTHYYQEAVLGEYTSSGTPNTAFGSAGFVHTNINDGPSQWNTLTVLSDATILAAGYGNEVGYQAAALAKYNSDGSLDTSFGSGGISLITAGLSGSAADAITVLSSGEIWIGGYGIDGSGESEFLLASFNPNGTTDGPFSLFAIGTGAAANAMALLPDGTLLVVGWGTDGSGNVDIAIADFDLS
jgi:uncharacterized delta-60 repeat protein